MSSARAKLARWSAGLVALALAAPALVVVASVGSDTGGLWSHLQGTVLPRYLRNTVLLALGVGVLTALVGTGTAWLVTLCRFPGRSWLRWGLLLPLATPAYLLAYAYTDLLQYSGPVQSAIRETFGLGRGDYWFPEVRSLGGAVVLLSLALYPYVYMAARSAFLEQSMCSLEASRTLGQSPWRSFSRVALPLARPSIAAGLALVLMETLAEFGAVQYCGVDTFATGIVRTFTLPSQFALTAAAQLSALLLGFVALLVFGEAWSRRSARYFHTTNRYRELSAWRLRGVKAWTAASVCALPVVLGFVLPALAFVALAIRGGDRRASEIFLEMARNSFALGAFAGMLAVLLAIAFSSLIRFDGSRAVRLAVGVAGMGYAVPGSVLAIGVLVLTTWGDHRLQGLREALGGSSGGLLLSGTAFALLYGYQSRFLAVALNFVRAAMTRVQPTFDGAARTLGAGPLATVWRVHLPMLRGSLLAAGLLVFVDVVKELPATLILRPFGLETLSVRVYQLASDERLAEASSGALAIIAVGLLPVVILSLLVDRSRANRAWSTGSALSGDADTRALKKPSPS